MEAAEFDATLKDLETRLDRLKALYEMYFQGIERLEPAVPRKQVDRMFELLRRDQPRSTHLRFRYQSLVQRYTTLATYWRRVTRQIEEGTYKRDLQKLKRKDLVKEGRAKRRDEREAEKGVYELDVDVELDTEDLSSLLDDPELDAAIAGLTRGPSPAPAPAAAPAPTPKVATFGKPTERRRRAGEEPTGAHATTAAAPAPLARPAPAPAPAPPRPENPGPDEVRMKRIYDDYVAARRSNNERVDNVKYETLQRSIADMIPKLKEKHQGKAIDFEVVVRDGRVGLKPVTK